MIKNLLVVVSSPVPGREEEYNRWYSEQHLPDVLRVPGFTAAQRFKLAGHGARSLPGAYLAIYEYETAAPDEDLAHAFAVLQKAIESGAMVISQAMEPASIHASLYAPITAKLGT